MAARDMRRFSGADIVATFNGQPIGKIESLSYTVKREEAPIYMMGDPNPRMFVRGKREIQGSLVVDEEAIDLIHQSMLDINKPRDLLITEEKDGIVKQTRYKDVQVVEGYLKYGSDDLGYNADFVAKEMDIKEFPNENEAAAKQLLKKDLL